MKKTREERASKTNTSRARAPWGISRSLQDGMVRLMGGVFDGSEDVFALEKGKKFKYVSYPQTVSANAGPAAALTFFDCDRDCDRLGVPGS
jgi:hypothetical protein